MFCIFRDIFSLLIDPVLYKTLMEIIVQRVKKYNPKPTTVAALESRGFLFGPYIAIALNLKFIPIRKKGKLPGKVESVSYELEYGTVSTLSLQFIINNKQNIF